MNWEIVTAVVALLISLLNWFGVRPVDLKKATYGWLSYFRLIDPRAWVLFGIINAANIYFLVSGGLTWLFVLTYALGFLAFLWFITWFKLIMIKRLSRKRKV